MFVFRYAKYFGTRAIVQRAVDRLNEQIGRNVARYGVVAYIHRADRAYLNPRVIYPHHST